MDSISLPQLIADVSFQHAVALIALLTLIRVVLLYNAGRTRRALAEILEAGIVALTLLFFVIQPFLGKTFYIPSGSMLPTLAVDDHIMVDKLTPRFHLPDQRSVIVFVAPQRALENSSDPEPSADGRPVDYVKRLIGLPGDVVVVRHGYIVVNGQEENHAAIRRILDLTDPNTQHIKIEQSDLVITEGAVTRYDAQQVAKLFGQPDGSVAFHPGQTFVNHIALNEPYIAEDPSYDFKLVNGHAVRVDPDDDIRFDGVDPNRAEMNLAQRPPCPVPAGAILVMGDNRNDSNDSTLWGPLPADHIVGKARFVFWPFNRSKAL